MTTNPPIIEVNDYICLTVYDDDSKEIYQHIGCVTRTEPDKDTNYPIYSIRPFDQLLARTYFKILAFDKATDEQVALYRLLGLTKVLLEGKSNVSGSIRTDVSGIQESTSNSDPGVNGCTKAQGI